jgi:hypothetical protein
VGSEVSGQRRVLAALRQLEIAVPASQPKPTPQPAHAESNDQRDSERNSKKNQEHRD